MSKIKRIDFVGNANSLPLTAAHALRKMGIDVHMHLCEDYYLNAPENRFKQYADGYPSWIHDWRPLNVPYSYDAKKMLQLREALQESDALVLNLASISLGCSLGKPYFCYFSGTDLLTYPKLEEMNKAISYIDDNSFIYLEEVLSKLSYIDFCEAQRLSIACANGYVFFSREAMPIGAEALDSIGADPARHHQFVVIDLESLPFSEPNWDGKRPLRILNAARCNWDRTAGPNLTDLDYKGTDVLLHGIAKAIEQGLSVEMHMYEKGFHIEQTKNLINELNLNNYVTWHGEVSQDEFLQAIVNADILADELDTSHVSMAVFDAFALGTPVLARKPDPKFTRIGEFPLFHANSSQLVAEQLLSIQKQPNDLNEMAIQARKFVEKYADGTMAANTILEALSTEAPPIHKALLHAERLDLYLKMANYFEYWEALKVRSIKLHAQVCAMQPAYDAYHKSFEYKLKCIARKLLHRFRNK